MATNRLTIELEPDETPRGRVLTAGGQGFPFEGWIGLAAALERARGAPADAEVEGRADDSIGRTGACG